jgi:hypothetical protein
LPLNFILHLNYYFRGFFATFFLKFKKKKIVFSCNCKLFSLHCAYSVAYFVFSRAGEVPEAFWTFVRLVSEEIDLKGWRKFRGDFAPTTESLKAYYTEWNGIESMLSSNLFIVLLSLSCSFFSLVFLLLVLFLSRMRRLFCCRFLSVILSNVLVMFHVAPLMNSEQLRRLVGNDITYVFYHDAMQPFNSSLLHNFGQVPHAFLVVQPIAERFRYAR